MNSCATIYHTTASRLTSVQDSPIPSSEALATLVGLEPRLAGANEAYGLLAEEIARLRLRTAYVLQRWFEVGIVAGGDCWADWEKRLADVEKSVRRAEMARKDT